MSTGDQRLSQIFKKQTKRLCSLELSPKTDIDYDRLEALKFSYCSVIWLGNYDKPLEEIEPLRVAAELIRRGYTTILHITARTLTKSSVRKILTYAKSIGVRNILVIRGSTEASYSENTEYDFPYSIHLINFIISLFGDYFDICVAGYPHKHPESKDMDEDMKNLKIKNDAGAKFVITQAAFSYDVYKQFLKNCRTYNITMQIIPGAYIIRSVVDFCLLKKLCRVPDDDPVIKYIKEHEGNNELIAHYGTKVSLEVIKKVLQDKDFCPPHIFTMNDLDSLCKTMDFL